MTNEKGFLTPDSGGLLAEGLVKNVRKGQLQGGGQALLGEVRRSGVNVIKLFVRYKLDHLSLVGLSSLV